MIFPSRSPSQAVLDISIFSGAWCSFLFLFGGGGGGEMGVDEGTYTNIKPEVVPSSGGTS